MIRQERDSVVPNTDGFPVIGRLLASQAGRDAARVASILAVFLIVDRLTLRIASLSPEGLTSPSLAFAAVTEKSWEAAVLALGLAGVVLAGRGRAAGPWSTLAHGAEARVAAVAGALWLAWGTSAYPFNYVLGVWHASDRVLVGLLAAGVAWRPIFLVPFVAQVRLLNGQFAHPLGTDYGVAADELIVVVLCVIAAAHLLHVALRSWSAPAVVLLVTTVLASHFFEPGLGKLELDWLTRNEVWQLPLNAQAAGWMVEGPFAAQLSGWLAALDGPVRLLTLAIELGALAAVAHRRLLLLWLPALLVFHVATFAATGFVFADWMALELGLLLLASLPRYRHLVAPEGALARAFVAVGTVAVGGFLYHPPRLAWLDAPVGYGYEIHGVGPGGERFRIDAADAAPFTETVTFGALVLTPRLPLSGGYGATGSPARLDRLRAVEDFDDLATLEARAPPTDEEIRRSSERLLVAFFEHVNVMDRPERFRTSGPSPAFERGRPLAELHVTRVTSLGVRGSREFRRALVLTIEDGGGGRGTVVLRREGRRP